MRIPYLFLSVLFCPYPVAGQQEDGTCSAEDGGTCASRAPDDAKSLCFPDGGCFGSLDEAVSHYQRVTTMIPMEIPKAYGESQRVDSRDPETYKKTLETLAATHEYMTHLYQNDTAKAFRDECTMRHDSCTFWASIGECEAVSTIVCGRKGGLFDLVGRSFFLTCVFPCLTDWCRFSFGE